MFHKIMEFKLKGADTYYNHGSTWIILTDKKQWVIELTKDGTLWYNFYFFQSILTGLMGFEDTVKNQNYITEWVEYTIQNGVKETNLHFLEILNSINFEPVIKEMKRINEVDIVLENGIKETKTPNHENPIDAFDFLKYNGTNYVPELIDEVIQNGIKETWGYEKQPQMRVNEVIRGEIKEINWRRVDNHPPLFGQYN